MPYGINELHLPHSLVTQRLVSCQTAKPSNLRLPRPPRLAALASQATSRQPQQHVPIATSARNAARHKKRTTHNTCQLDF